MARWFLSLFLLTLFLAVGVGAWQWQAKNLVAPFSLADTPLAPFLDDLRQAGEVLTPGPLTGPLGQTNSILTPAGILTATNEQRSIHDRPALRANTTLDKAAQKKVDDMFARQYFSHEAPDGTGPSDLVDGVHYEYIRVGENLALGNFASDKDLVQAWMDSPGHRENILHSGFSELGVAVGKGDFEGTDVWLAVQTFAAPLSSCPSVDPALQKKFDQLKTELDQLAQQLQTQEDPLATEQAVLEELANEIQTLADNGNAKISAGNAKIEQGNQVYKDTGDREQAEVHWEEGKRLQSEGEALLNEATAKQRTYTTRAENLTSSSTSFNQLVAKQRSLNEQIRTTSTSLNQQIRAFNDCIK